MAIAEAYDIERGVALGASSLLFVLYMIQIINSEVSHGMVKIWFQRYGLIGSLLALLNAIDAHGFYGSYGPAYVMVVFYFHNTTLVLCMAGFSAAYYSLRSFYQITDKKEPPGWIKVVIQIFMLLTFMVNNGIAIAVQFGEEGGIYPAVILLWLFCLGIVYDFLFNYSFYQLRSTVMGFRQQLLTTQKRTSDAATPPQDDKVESGLHAMKLFQYISTFLVSLASIACLALGLQQIEDGLDVAQPDSYDSTKGILMWLQLILLACFLWFCWQRVTCKRIMESIRGSTAGGSSQYGGGRV